MSLKRSMRLGAAVAGVAAFFSTVGTAWSQIDLGKQALEANPGLTARPDALLVKFRPDASPAARDAARMAVAGNTLKAYTIVKDLELLSVGVGNDRAKQVLALFPHVEYAEEDLVVRTSLTPNDPGFSLLYGLHNTGQNIGGSVGIVDADIDAPEAWNTTTGDPNFVIAVIDTGTQYTHPDLSANIWINPGEIAGNGIDDDGNGYADDVRGWDFYDNDSNPDDTNGHGTHVAGTIGAVGNNGVGVAGVNWRCKIMVLRFLGPQGGYTSDAIEAVQYASARGVRISNNSWGGGGYSSSLYSAISAAGNAGHLFVAAAGNANNNNDANPFYPASYNLASILSVAATDNRDNRASFSNYGLTSVDLGAPGVNTYSTYRGSTYAYLSGTSMASPHVAGVAALVAAANPSWTPAQVKSRLMSTTRAIAALNGRCVTGGVVNAAAAVGGTTNTAPSVTISSPANGSSVSQGTAVTFTGSASDAQDGSLTANLVWTSSLQGQIGTGGSFSRSDLVVGTHVVTASVTDSGGLPGSAQVTLTVQTSGGTIPATPGSPSLTRLSSTQVRVDWGDNSNNETSFEIERSQRVNNRYQTPVLVGTVGANITTFTDTVTPGYRYRYRVRAVNGAGASAWSAWRVIVM